MGWMLKLSAGDSSGVGGGMNLPEGFDPSILEKFQQQKPPQEADEL